MNSGKHIRLQRLFAEDGKTVIAALDHGIAGLSPLHALETPEHLLPALTKAGVDAVITTPGMASAFDGLLGRTGLILRADCGPTALTGKWSETSPAVAVEDAIRLGADAVIAMGIVGADGEAESLKSLAKLAAECEKWGIALFAEMLPGGFSAAEVAAEQIAVAARLGADLGAGVIKIRYSGSLESFRPVVRSSFRPIVVLGGSKQSPEQLVASTHDAIAAGAKGVAVGRNIWKASDPAGVAALLIEAVHG